MMSSASRAQEPPSLGAAYGPVYCAINNTNQLRLLVTMCFWVKKGSMGGQISWPTKDGNPSWIVNGRQEPR